MSDNTNSDLLEKTKTLMQKLEQSHLSEITAEKIQQAIDILGGDLKVEIHQSRNSTVTLYIITLLAIKLFELQESFIPAKTVTLDHTPFPTKEMEALIKKINKEANNHPMSDLPLERVCQAMLNNDGEIRIKPARYNPGWHALGCCEIPWSEKLDAIWEKLTDGDQDYFDAINELKNLPCTAFIKDAGSLQTAFNLCLTALSN